MANESTAIVELISLVRGKPMPRQSDEDLLFAAPTAGPPRRIARGTSILHGFEDDHALTHRVVRRDVTKPLFAATLAVASLAAFALTVRLTRHKSPAPAAAVVATQTSAPDVMPLPVPAPVTAPVPPPIQLTVSPIEQPTPAHAAAARPELVALALESQPSGATVTLVDRGASAEAGTTPLSLSVDPSREYDLVFTLPGHPTKLAHVDPHATQHVAIDLSPVTVQPPEAPAHHHGHTRRARVRRVK